jgi:hypothetical protein
MLTARYDFLAGRSQIINKARPLGVRTSPTGRKPALSRLLIAANDLNGDVVIFNVFTYPATPASR